MFSILRAGDHWALRRVIQTLGSNLIKLVTVNPENNSRQHLHKQYYHCNLLEYIHDCSSCTSVVYTLTVQYTVCSQYIQAVTMSPKARHMRAAEAYGCRLYVLILCLQQITHLERIISNIHKQ